jgi:antitoxin YefM
MDTITATKARSDLFNIIKKTIKGHRQIKISSKEGSAVLISEEDYENLIETLHLLSIPGLKESIGEADEEIAQGETYSIEDSFPSDST